jgi:hypothetical protein
LAVLTDDQTVKFRAGEVIVYLYARCTYRDIFQPDLRVTEVMYRATHQGGTYGTSEMEAEAVSFDVCGRPQAT